MNRYKSFDSSGNAPNGRLYSGDLNAIQDAAAALTDLAQIISIGQMRLGESGLQLLRFGTLDARLTGALRTDGIVRALGGLYAGAFTTTQRDAIASGSRPPGLIVFNTTNNRLEMNFGSDASPSWGPVGPALGTAAGQALPGDHFAATPEKTSYVAGPVGNGATYTLTCDVAGTYVIEWGAGKATSQVQGGSASISCNKAGGVAQYADFGAGGPMVRGGVALSAAEVITFTISANNYTLEHLWGKITRTA